MTKPPPTPPGNLHSSANEVEVYVEPDKTRLFVFETKFGRIGDPPKFIDGHLESGEVVPPVLLFTLDCVASALEPTWATCECERGGTFTTATPGGFITVSSLDGSWVWELLPVRWSDGVNYPCYIGKWPD